MKINLFVIFYSSSIVVINNRIKISGSLFISEIVSKSLVVLVLVTIHLFQTTSIDYKTSVKKSLQNLELFATNYFEQRIFTSNWVIKPKRTDQFKIFPKLITFS